MTADEIVTLLDSMTARWGLDPSPWLDVLEPVSYDEARGVLNRAVKELEGPPTVGWFLGEVRRDLPPPPTRVIDPIGQARAAFTTQNRVHDHRGGWRSCPICIDHPPTVPTGNPKDAA